jgi:hypothetical protein
LTVLKLIVLYKHENRRNSLKVWWENQKKSGYLEYLGVDGKIKLKLNRCDGEMWTR